MVATALMVFWHCTKFALDLASLLDVSCNQHFFFVLCFRLRAASRAQGDSARKTRPRDRGVRAMPAPEANAELQSNIDVCPIACLYSKIIILFLMLYYF